MDINFWALFGLVSRLVAIGMLFFYVVPKQFRETQRPRNKFTRLRWLLLFLPLFYLLASGPTLISLFATSFLQTNPVLINIARVTSALAQIAMALSFVLIYNYKED